MARPLENGRSVDCSLLFPVVIPETQKWHTLGITGSAILDLLALKAGGTVGLI